MKAQKVWLVGANSFTGNYLIPALENANYEVDTSKVDITNAKEVEQMMCHIQPEYVINLAAITFVPDGASESIYAVNTFGPQHILEAGLKLKNPLKKIILAGSANVYGVQDRERIDEACPPNPVNHYGCSKWSMEQIARTYSDRLNITITRPFNYTGRNQDEKFLVPKIVNHFKQKADVIRLGNIDVWRDFSDVRWISEAYVALLSNPAADAKVVNLCSGRLTSIRDIIEYLQQLTGVDLQVETDSRFVRQADIKRQCGNNRYLFQQTPNLSQPIDFKETLRWMVQSA